jgi:Ca2+-binding RTX toxin-like protein
MASLKFGGLPDALYHDGETYTLSMTDTTATWTGSAHTVTVTGTDLDTDHGVITKIVSGNTTLSNLNVDFSAFRAGIDDGDWNEIGTALQGIDIRTPDGIRGIFQGLGGDDDVSFSQQDGQVYFDGGNDVINFYTGEEDDFTPDNNVYLASLNYQPDYETLRWEINGGTGINSLWLWRDPSTAPSGSTLYNIATGGLTVTVGKEFTFLDGTALFNNIDMVSGTPWDDTITGDDNYNSLRGQGGADRLYGAGGNDEILGGTGNDYIVGGKGGDTLRGLAGADLFVLKKISDSTLASPGQDVIGDFSRAEGDTIDLHVIDADTTRKGNQAFDFIGKDHFHHEAGELRYVQKDGQTYIFGDVDGDSKADFSLLATGKIHFGEIDFHL